ncbi:HlyD family secretion protein [Modicisalibacter radicis]|uniref:HlyD family secretion protein n=1 Tax=Halomonas sp. EAR18 TaxID=2518972 RepID=UPI00109D3E96|nr:HlyD family efflux transporter periplasmic adaptor subunit [Halomonas sp. EAR18]
MRPLKCLLSALTLCLPILLAGCDGPDEGLPGTVEWDRIDILADVSEPVVALSVHEGDQVQRGQLLLRLDPRRVQAQLDTARANLASLQATLDELRHGARQETIDAARAALAEAQSNQHNAQLAYDRARRLFASHNLARSQLDDAENTLHMNSAQTRNRQAQLDELLHGTRIEELERARANVAGAEAEAARLTVTRQRLDVTAPAPGRVDALPHRLGDQPVQGATLVSLLGGEAPYARIFLPESWRAQAHPGERFRIKVDGIDKTFEAHLRSVRSDPAFTPYYALTGDDATRLSYRAELVLEGASAHDLPAGVPCHVWPHDGDDDDHDER